MTTIKFCGLTRPEDAQFASLLGASYAGVIFAGDSPRRVTAEAARLIFAGIPARVERVGVFRDAPAASVASAAADACLDVIQMHGLPGIQRVRMLRSLFPGKIWIVAGIDPASESIGQQAHELASEADAILLDTSVGGVSGGSGTAFDWQALADDVRTLATTAPVIIAGGLTATNVGDAIRLLAPVTVDVSSGVEVSPGIKDHDLMRSFAEAVRSAS